MSNPKELRKQLRNVIQDLGPDLIKSELYDAALKQVRDEIKLRLDAVETHVKETLQTLDNRQKDIQSFLVRASIAAQGQAQVNEEISLETPAPTETPAAPTEDKSS